MSNVAQKEVKEIITSALYGNVDMQETIEILSDLLFPGENLKEQILNQKVINDITKKVSLFKEKVQVELKGIKKEDKLFLVTLEFEDVRDFLSEQQMILAHLTQVAKAYNVTLTTTFMISHTIS